MYAVIMAGGAGTRLWPISREARPKQLHALVTNKPMIRETVDRLVPLVSLEDVFVITSAAHRAQVCELLADVPSENIVGEPFPLGTMLAVGLAAVMVAKRDPQATMLVAWSDSHISEPENYFASLLLASRACQVADGVIIGVKPTFPATGYGYILMGDEVVELHPERVYWIDRFIEKPDLETAKRFVRRWGYLWNPGISVWRVDKLLGLYKRLRPRDYEALMAVQPYLNTPEQNDAIARELGSLEKIAIDYAIYEKAERLAVVPADLGWSDIGTWASLKDALENNCGTNYVRGEHVGLFTENCLVLGHDRLIATLGVSDLVIVDAGDCILVAHRDRSQEVKDLVELLRKCGKEQYL
jgi:mannose-1-phosphate guanylyltransferase